LSYYRQSWEHLNDWPKLLSESKKYLHKVSPQKKVNALLGDAAPRYMKFLVSITQRETAARHIKVLTNIDIAALNLHIMLEVPYVTPFLPIPYLTVLLLGKP
jgi:hypothetical protein